MSATLATFAGRKAAEALMVDACTIAAPSSDRSFEQGEYTTIPGPERYTGKCKVQVQGTRPPKTSTDADTLLSLVVVEVHVPVSVAGVAVHVEVHDLVTITSSVLDPDLVGRVYRVMDHPGKTFATARKMRCEEYR